MRTALSPAAAAALVPDDATVMAVIGPTPDGLVLRERAPDVSIQAVREATGTELLVPEIVPEMEFPDHLAMQSGQCTPTPSRP